MKKLAIAAGILLAAVGVAGGYALYRKHQGRDVRGSTVEFSTTQKKPTPPPPPRIAWPQYGYDASKLRSPPGFRTIRPPYRPIWRFRARKLLEFPPAVAYGRLYITNNIGTFFAIDAKTGRLAWKHATGRCTAASPAVYRGLVFATFLNRLPCNGGQSHLDGLLIAFDARTGRVQWQKTIGPSESSPLIADGVVYVGDWNSHVYAFTATTGRLHWKFSTGDKVKGGPAIWGGRIYIGSYDGHVYALNARTGRQLWRASVQERLGPHGTFYSGAAVAYGRVYIGATDGKVYSYGARSGKLRWSHGTGNYVYASPAIWRGRVLVGSYDGTFYSFDAATGDVRWKFNAGGPISGSATVINGIVYFSTVRGRTFGLSASTGRVLWRYADGQYGSVVADRERMYLTGWVAVWGFSPGQPAQAAAAASRPGK